MAASGRDLTGVALPWNQAATVLDAAGAVVRERFEPRAVTYYAANLPLVAGHGGPELARLGAGLDLSSRDDGLHFTARANRDVTPTGASIEFQAIDELREGDTRVIKAAILTGIAILEAPVRPAYSGAIVEARARVEVRQNGAISGSIPHEPFAVATTGRTRKEGIQHRGLAWRGGQVVNKQGKVVGGYGDATTAEPSLLLGRGSSAQPIASTSNGSLKIVD